MTVKIGINGFGRMGRLGLRAGWRKKGLDFTHINEMSCDAECSSHLLKFDSIHGKWDKKVCHIESAIIVEGKEIKYSRFDRSEEADWYGVDIVIEATGKFKTVETLQAYFDQGVKKVIVAAPVKEGALNVVMGVNDYLYKPEKHNIITAASCTTNCLAPVVKVMHEKIGIERGAMTTIHDITNTQTIIDKGHKDLRRARACSLSIIPTSTGSAKAITQIFPDLEGKLNGLAARVPQLNASLTDFVFDTTRDTTVEEVNQLLKEASESYLKGILGYEELPLVSIDYKDDIRSSVIDALSTMVIDRKLVKILSWYDNEIGYVNRMMELAEKVAKSL